MAYRLKISKDVSRRTFLIKVFSKNILIKKFETIKLTIFEFKHMLKISKRDWLSLMESDPWYFKALAKEKEGTPEPSEQPKP
jgi:hypothetical protein